MGDTAARALLPQLGGEAVADPSAIRQDQP